MNPRPSLITHMDKLGIKEAFVAFCRKNPSVAAIQRWLRTHGVAEHKILTDYKRVRKALDCPGKKGGIYRYEGAN